ncbi:hypothetical protein, conserved [Eimeria maxima]|uniref:Uncharacterized protein n=1 Tax=Eimeria maxima TaxID=5804 RepID=U6LYL6_EIMMA|nr:hypothetical protein, conserved [Eimeria maxima]CDJ55968.1 hypothetical protein, conserved [Eimeria maxima]
MATVLLLLHWLSSSTAHAAPFLLHQHSVHAQVRSMLPDGIHEVAPVGASSGGPLLSFLLCSGQTISNRPNRTAGPPWLWGAPTLTLQRLSSNTQLFACRPRPKKEKARRNYRIAKQQKQIREERLIRRRQQLEIFKARQRLLMASEGREEFKTNEDNSQTGNQSKSLFSLDGPLFAAEQTTANNNSNAAQGIDSTAAARINYRLVGGTWRRARGQGKYVRMSGAQLAAAIFEGLPEEEVTAAVARAKRQDEGFMDLEAYDESGTEHTTLEGLN